MSETGQGEPSLADFTINRLEAEISRLRQLVYLPGDWKCDTCGFELSNRILHASTGDVSAPRMTAHTPEQLRVAVCEALGWREILWCELTNPREAREHKFYCRSNEDQHCGWLPHLTLDLMHEAEKLLKRSPLLWGQYCNTLALMCGGAREDDGGLFVSHKEAIDANAEQRARAFVAVKQG